MTRDEDAVTLALDDGPAEFVNDKRAGWWLVSPSEREATLTEVEMLRTIVRLRELASERDRFASMLYDCENERDGLKDRLAAVEAERDAYKQQRDEMDRVWREDTEHSVTLRHRAEQAERERDALRDVRIGHRYLVEATSYHLEKTRADRAERILAALREPSEAVVYAMIQRTVEGIHGGDVGEIRHAILVALPAAVAAAEREVTNA